MGRTAFGTGIGHLTESWAELLGRAYDVAIWDLHDRRPERGFVTLGTGREVAVTDSLDGFAVYIYADVLWNGVGSTQYQAPPATGHRIAFLAFDSDELPGEWVEILNRDFDAVYFTSAHLIDVAERSGVRIEIGALPLALDVEHLVAARYRPAVGRRTRFGAVSSYHPRKGLELLVTAFLAEFGDAGDVELVIHSNLAIGETAAAVRAMVTGAGSSNITLSTANLSNREKDALIGSFDVFVNVAAGEGFSVGPREALAQGKPLVLSDLGAHRPLLGLPGTFTVTASHRVAAIYPEIDGRQFGRQEALSLDSLRKALRDAYGFVRTPEATATAGVRKLAAAEYSLAALERTYWTIVDPDSRGLLGHRRLSPAAEIPPGQQRSAGAHAGRAGYRLGATKVVIPANDGGFFSLYNTYLSHLVWSMHDSPQRMVLPDWDAGRLLARIAPARPVSYCYSTPEQGNLWNHLFEPPYGLAPADLDDPDFLLSGSYEPDAQFNERREPNLTYTHAFKLYTSSAFARIRRQYNSVIRDHVRLLPGLRTELDEFLTRYRDDRFLVAAHIKHPSHAVEQPDRVIADRYAYLNLVRGALAERGIHEADDGWAVFLATEQERVVALFREEFGDHVIQFADVARIPSERDTAFDTLPDEDKVADGHQLQHIMASDTSRWGPRLAWEVIRDAHVMASADVLFHAVSNVATAVSFLGPTVDMRFANP